MKIETNIGALKTDAFYRDLLPSNELIKARSEFDQAGRNIDPSKYAQATKRLNKANNLCAKLVRQQYSPLIKNIVIASLKDWKLFAEADNAKVGGSTFDSTTFEVLYHMVGAVIIMSVKGCNAYLHIANALKPMILKALKELENDNQVSVARPRRKTFGGVARYRWDGQ